MVYRGRLAPSPTGYLHLGHAATFWVAQERARAAGGTMVLRVEDIDVGRCREEFRDALLEDLRWFGLEWDEGPSFQSGRRAFYLDGWQKLHAGGFIYPCNCSRQDVTNAATAPHDENDEPVYPGTCRPPPGTISAAAAPAGVHWRFRVPDGTEMQFEDQRLGVRRAVAGRDFGDFVIWRRDDVPAYQLAVVVDDAAMRITEVVRAEDLLVSTFRQLLIYKALQIEPPRFYHAPLITDTAGKRLAKRHAALSLRALRESGRSPEDLRAGLRGPTPP
ncbi:MAG: tRNA glutamyl-Q(34) synthetase GluQRS [Chthoniobacterales bacterium]